MSLGSKTNLLNVRDNFFQVPSYSVLHHQLLPRVHLNIVLLTFDGHQNLAPSYFSKAEISWPLDLEITSEMLRWVYSLQILFFLKLTVVECCVVLLWNLCRFIYDGDWVTWHSEIGLYWGKKNIESQCFWFSKASQVTRTDRAGNPPNTVKTSIFFMWQ